MTHTSTSHTGEFVPATVHGTQALAPEAALAVSLDCSLQDTHEPSNHTENNYEGLSTTNGIPVAIIQSSSDAITIEIKHKPSTMTAHISDWLGTCVEAIISRPRVTYVTMIVPHILCPAMVDGPSEFTTLATAERVWRHLATQGRKDVEVRLNITATYNSAVKSKIQRAGTPTHRSLTFVAKAAAESPDDSNTVLSVCPVLEAAERALHAGDLSAICAYGLYTDARTTVDEIHALAYQGFISLKRKSRPMPEWLTAEQERDLRDGPPGWGRRAKRAMLGFLGGFEDPGRYLRSAPHCGPHPGGTVKK
jgi:hypothetical protein